MKQTHIITESYKDYSRRKQDKFYEGLVMRYFMIPALVALFVFVAILQYNFTYDGQSIKNAFFTFLYVFIACFVCWWLVLFILRRIKKNGANLYKKKRR